MYPGVPRREVPPLRHLLQKLLQILVPVSFESRSLEAHRAPVSVTLVSPKTPSFALRFTHAFRGERFVEANEETRNVNGNDNESTSEQSIKQSIKQASKQERKEEEREREGAKQPIRLPNVQGRGMQHFGRGV